MALVVERIEKADKEVGAEAGRHEGDNLGMYGHTPRMNKLR